MRRNRLALALLAGLAAGIVPAAGQAQVDSAPADLVQSPEPETDATGEAAGDDLQGEEPSVEPATEDPASDFAEEPIDDPAADDAASEEIVIDAPAVDAPAADTPEATLDEGIVEEPSSDVAEEAQPEESAPLAAEEPALEVAPLRSEPDPAAPALRNPNPLANLDLDSLSATRSLPLFSPTRSPPPEPEPEPEPEVVVEEPEPEAPPSPPDLQLVGILQAGTEEVAMLMDPASNEIHRLNTGDEYNGWEIEIFDSRTIEFFREGQSVMVRMFDEFAPAPEFGNISDAYDEENYEDEDTYTVPQRRREPRFENRPGSRQPLFRPGGDEAENFDEDEENFEEENYDEEAVEGDDLQQVDPSLNEEPVNESPVDDSPQQEEFSLTPATPADDAGSASPESRATSGQEFALPVVRPPPADGAQQ